MTLHLEVREEGEGAQATQADWEAVGHGDQTVVLQDSLAGGNVLAGHQHPPHPGPGGLREQLGHLECGGKTGGNITRLFTLSVWREEGGAALLNMRKVHSDLSPPEK